MEATEVKTLQARTLESVQEWHRRACPDPTQRDLDVGLGCHLEEVGEMLAAMQFDAQHETYRRDTLAMIEMLAHALKKGEATIVVLDRKEVCDGIADQIVTGTGFGYRLGMNIPHAVERVDFSNWTKFVDGKALFNENRKIIKGPYYVPADLEGCY
jgi:hypothetical protein